jgi:hypothetical protein
MRQLPHPASFKTRYGVVAESLQVRAADELIRRLRARGEDEEAERLEERMRRSGWIAPDEPPIDLG